MKLQTRQEIVDRKEGDSGDGKAGKIMYEITNENSILIDRTLILLEREAKELYELLKEKFEKNTKN